MPRYNQRAISEVETDAHSPKLLPGQKGTKELVRKYGDTLLCIRYRYDEVTSTLIKTVELNVEKKPWSPPAPRYRDEKLITVRVAYETERTLV